MSAGFTLPPGTRMQFVGEERLVADEMVGLFGNSMFGRAEDATLVAQFTSQAKAEEYERLSLLPGGPYSETHEGYSMTYRPESLLRPFNQIPVDFNFGRPRRFEPLRWLRQDVPIDPAPPEAN